MASFLLLCQEILLGSGFPRQLPVILCTIHFFLPGMQTAQPSSPDSRGNEVPASPEGTSALLLTQARKQAGTCSAPDKGGDKREAWTLPLHPPGAQNFTVKTLVIFHPRRNSAQVCWKLQRLMGRQERRAQPRPGPPGQPPPALLWIRPPEGGSRHSG